MPCSPFSLRRSSRICAWTVTSSAVVGSVGDQQFGPIGERHGDHHTLTLAAREFMRIGFQPFFRLADADLVQQLQHAGTRRLPGHTLMQCEDFRQSAFRSYGAD